MPKYFVRATYNAEGAKGLLREGGTLRRKATERTLRSVGAKLESFYFGFGETNVYLIVDAPDNASVAALSLAVKASGASEASFTALLTPEEMDEAVKKGARYYPPGGKK